jgi:hypothetical protein
VNISVVLICKYVDKWADNKVRELDIRGIVHYEFVPTGHKVNKVYYLEVLKRLREKLDGNDPTFLPTTHGSCITALSVREFLATK